MRGGFAAAPQDSSCGANEPFRTISSDEQRRQLRETLNWRKFLSLKNGN
jgi:hypothetical protein